MDSTAIKNSETLPLTEGDIDNEQPSISEQLQLLNLYLYLDARRYGTSV